ncbi:4-demethylwyosine synthase TYW1 [Candidatus Woesearchaeota archaeon]|nr:4-demethylwyosine synthase TYW1 [Candidatus Woesearchaeota archaeon]
MLTKESRQTLEKQQYGIAGRHSAVKICSWTKKSIRNEDVCYKEKFYGIKSHRCMQITPNLACCNRCIFCWRDLSTPTVTEWKKEWQIDSPEEIFLKCLEEHRKLLIGFRGNEKADKQKLAEAFEPNQVAISLSGEPVLYPKINQLIKLLKEKGMSTFLVTNGQYPDILENIELPSQLYISIDAPNKELFEKIEQSAHPDAWERFNRSLEAVRKLKCKTAARITLIKNVNMEDLDGYKQLIQKAMPNYIEVKAYMFVGSSRQRLTIKHMPYHEEVKQFAIELEKILPDYKIVDEKAESRVVLLEKIKD